MPKHEPLRVWLHGMHVATLTSSKPGEVTGRYTEEALDTHPRNSPLLSCSLPLANRTYRADVFFSGLLPEGQHRQAMADAARLPTYDTFGILDRFGRDVAGALIISSEDPFARMGETVEYAPGRLDDEVAALPERPLALYDDSELSIAGLQNKLLLVDLGSGRWARPVHGTPSTHILKVEDRRYPGLVAAEAACLQIARALGLTTVDTTVETLADIPCLIVSRFDRINAPSGVQRIHQEDATQALNRDPAANEGRGKYESFGGPSWTEVASLLDKYSAQPLVELTRLLAAMAFTVCVGNADAHGKNISLLHPTPQTISLAPLYDTVPTALWPRLPARAAMLVNGRTTLADVTLDDLVAEGVSWSLDPTAARDAATETIEAVLSTIADIDASPELVELIRRRSEELSHS
ncbi:MAG: HipA domain-containing protein [Acidimicrobiales bacterium]